MATRYNFEAIDVKLGGNVEILVSLSSLMKNYPTFDNRRREYGSIGLSEAQSCLNPFEQFARWFTEILTTEGNDPTAMVLSTVDEQGLPDSRVVLLKGIKKGAFFFYTNYESNKGKQLAKTPYAALNFYWPQLARQVRIRGHVKRASKLQSDRYFLNRPFSSQISAIASPQSLPIPNREWLEEAINKLLTIHQDTAMYRPHHWGGYRVIPQEFEFWQGRDNRLHDRLHYIYKNKTWIRQRLAP